MARTRIFTHIVRPCFLDDGRALCHRVLSPMRGWDYLPPNYLCQGDIETFSGSRVAVPARVQSCEYLIYFTYGVRVYLTCNIGRDGRSACDGVCMHSSYDCSRSSGYKVGASDLHVDLRSRIRSHVY